MTKWHNALFSAVLFIALGWSQAAKACTCLEAPLDDRVSNADVIFSGTVEDVMTISRYMDRSMVDRPIEVRLSVDDTYKGTKKVRNNEFTLHTSQHQINCAGYTFVPGDRLLVYAYARRDSTREHWSLYNFPSGTYGVGGNCGGTKSLKSPEAVQEARELSKAKNSN